MVLITSMSAELFTQEIKAPPFGKRYHDPDRQSVGKKPGPEYEAKRCSGMLPLASFKRSLIDPCSTDQMKSA